MKLEKMIIKNYRQFEHAELEFDNDVTIVAGANNSGKTSLITLIKNVLYQNQHLDQLNLKDHYIYHMLILITRFEFLNLTHY